MPSEIRHLLFRPPEIVQALQAFHRRLGKPLASGVIGECRLCGDGQDSDVTFRLHIHADRSSGRGAEIEFDSITLVAALIMFCRDNRIPLPARAPKSLQRLGEQLCLVATYG